LILTIMVKVLVYPATWKTYMSSAKMRVLKPKIDEINNLGAVRIRIRSLIGAVRERDANTQQ